MQENFQSVKQRNIGPDPDMYLQSLYAPFGICKNNIFSGRGLSIAKAELDSAFRQFHISLNGGSLFVLRHNAGQEGRGEILLENSFCDDDATREK